MFKSVYFHPAVVCFFVLPPTHPPTNPCTSVHQQGTLFNALAVGACVYGVGLTGVLKAEWVPAAALLFGVITSAVDPVAVSVTSSVCVCTRVQ